jgi:peptide/nickel transport system substrate-binding protein
MKLWRGLLLICVCSLLACMPSVPGAQPAPAPGSEGPGTANTRSAAEQRTLIVAIRGEPSSLSVKEWVEGLALGNVKRFFGAYLTISDEREDVRPYLAESLPSLNTDTWKVFPDGKMETTYRLKSNLTWHDGAPLTASDFLFANTVYATPELGQSRLIPQRYVEEVLAPDPQTVVIRWKELFPDAGILSTDFEPLPRHLLEETFRQGPLEVFGSLPYWTKDYVGLGPYRVEHWEPGAFVVGTAFTGHVLGRPKIERIETRFIPDPNTVLANVLAGAVHVTLDRALNFPQVPVLKSELVTQKGGLLLLSPSNKRWTQVQFRPDVVSPRVLLDVRARQALTHAIDRNAISEVVYEGQGAPMDSLLVFPYERWFPAVDRAVVKYPYDLRRTDQLMADLGYARGSDGFFSSPTEGRLSIEARISAGVQNEQELSVLADGWRRAGFDITERPYPVALSSDGQFRATFPGLLHNSAGGAANSLITSGIPRPENRWAGANRGGWSDPAYDRLYDAFNTTLDVGQRNQQIAEMARLTSEQLPVLPVVYDFTVVAHVRELRGPKNGSPAANNWDAHLWEWQ